MSRMKGKRGELELAHELERLGMFARRAQQYSGATGDAADLIVDGLTAHIECKRVEQIRLRPWMEQAQRDAHGRPWLIITRQSRSPWMVIQTLEHWCADSIDAERARTTRIARFTQALSDGV